MEKKIRKRLRVARASPNHEIVRFLLVFISTFLFLYFFTLIYAGACAPGGLYIPFLDKYLNYVQGLRNILLHSSAYVLNLLGYQTRTNMSELLVIGHSKINLAYDCLGFGLMSFFCAFIIAWPEKCRKKIIFLIAGLIGIQILNILRFVLLGLYWHSASVRIGIDHHVLFNTMMYLIISICLFFFMSGNKRKAR
ncbi:MAG: archaeosortase/exosortase family protein [Mucilaginibacter polytrichastri]|nr:archaeosortase/exosortase family protein [Mucilaginibacter polytrichastri]